MQDDKLGQWHKIYTQRISNKIYKVIKYVLIAWVLAVFLQLLLPTPDEDAPYLAAVICGFVAWYIHQFSHAKLSIWHDPRTDVVRILDDWDEIGRLKIDFTSKKTKLRTVEYGVVEVLFDEIPFAYRHTITAIRKGRFIINRVIMKRV